MHSHTHTVAPHNEKFGCLRCKAGYTGTIKNWGDENCREYDVEGGECKVCAPKYYFIKDKEHDACTLIDTSATTLHTEVPTNYKNCE